MNAVLAFTCLQSLLATETCAALRAKYDYVLARYVCTADIVSRYVSVVLELVSSDRNPVFGAGMRDHWCRALFRGATIDYGGLALFVHSMMQFCWSLEDKQHTLLNGITLSL
jgi:hypothetical protein